MRKLSHQEVREATHMIELVSRSLKHLTRSALSRLSRFQIHNILEVEKLRHQEAAADSARSLP